MSRFTIVVAGREQNPHASCFNEITKALAEALRELGHEVTGLDNPGRIIGFNCEKWNGVTLPPDAIVFNAEQVGSAGGVKQGMWNFGQWRNHVIWDYAQRNIDALKAAGAERVVHCPVGYMPSMSYIAPAPVQDIDVLFYGSMNAKRREIMNAVSATGLNLVYLFGAYDAERDDAIARSKVVLNLHYFENALFEIFRVSHLLANKKCVISENGGSDPQLEAFAKQATVLCDRDVIAEACVSFVKLDHARQSMETRGHEAFAAINFVESVRRALEQS